jgi:predicted nucleic acid-binding protein
MPSKQQRFGLDSSCVIALLSDWHIHHRTTLDCYQNLIAAGGIPVVPGHALLESFAVMTRLPAPYRVPPELAKQVLETSFANTAVIEAVTSAGVWATMDLVAQQGLGGGRIYDAMIASSVLEARAHVLYTWNVKHFAAVAPAALEIRQPFIDHATR